ncbi:MAG TPA: flagellar motor stator protein MotA [Bryobacteraceae bacterium]|nr:flagellar motor stator protein MotA [Bryobacteraceae bacterium]
MFGIIGIVIVFGAVIGGFLSEHGNLKVLMQPAELLIIGGASIGTILIANPIAVLKGIAAALPGVFKPSKFDKASYLTILTQLNRVMQKARKQGLAALEPEVDKPEASELFKDIEHHLRNFICDTLRVAMAGDPSPYDLDQLMELDMEVHHHEAHQPVEALTTVADALPGLGIVAAVLGVVITMGALGGPPEEIGHKVAAALVGTFLGILLCYGLLGPIASKMGKDADEAGHVYHTVRVAVISFMKGSSPLIALEFARRVTPGHARPSFSELESACRAKGAAAPAAVPEASAA